MYAPEKAAGPGFNPRPGLQTRPGQSFSIRKNFIANNDPEKRGTIFDTTLVRLGH